jgi:hypothetical protein
LACCTRRPAAAGGGETSNGVPTRVEVRIEAFSDAGSTPAASTTYQHELIEPSGSAQTRSLTQVPELGVMAARFWDEPADDDKTAYDPLYVLNRDSEFRDDVRDFVEKLWVRYERFCGDVNFLEEAKRQFQQFTWQMYVGVCLLEAGHVLERAAPEGPDHKTVMNGRRVWVECIAPKAGHGENLAKRTIQSWTETETGGYGMFKPPPDEKIQARLTGALLNKVQQHRKWIEKGIVSPDDPFIVAIGAGIIPDTDLHYGPPHIVQALYGVRGPALTYELGSNKEAELVPQYRDEIPRIVKTNGRETSAPISLRGFLDDKLYPEASAVIFCSQGVWNPPRRIGRDLITVYNAVAKQLLEPGTVSIGQEYWVEDGTLRHRDHRVPLSALDGPPSSTGSVT